MNGRDLARNYGFPVQAIVPSYYGLASVNWLTRIQAVSEPFHCCWQTSDYAYWASMDGKPVPPRPLFYQALTKLGGNLGSDDAAASTGSLLPSVSCADLNTSTIEPDKGSSFMVG